jgi:hypothetical protein
MSIFEMQNTIIILAVILSADRERMDNMIDIRYVDSKGF